MDHVLWSNLGAPGIFPFVLNIGFTEGARDVTHLLPGLLQKNVILHIVE